MNFKNALIYTEKFCFERGNFSVFEGKFASVLAEAAEDAVDLRGAKVIPGLIDVHTHGNSGEDFCDASYEGLKKMAAYEAGNGITSFAPASFTLPYEELRKAFLVARRIAEERPENCAAIRGIHMEGPFFSEAKKGAQNGAYLRNPDYEAFYKLFECSGGLVKIVDVAPELPGAAEFIEKASKDCRVSLAHTDTDYEHAVTAIEAGATHITHLFNAMPSIHHRKPGLIPAAAENEKVSVELIGDGLHVHPAVVRLAFRLFGAERIVLVSDSLRCCGLPDGQYDSGSLPVILSGGVARLQDGTIAGSATNLFECMRRVISFGIGECEAIRAASYNPARQLGCLAEVGSIADGKAADFVICRDDLSVLAVFLAGREVK